MLIDSRTTKYVQNYSQAIIHVFLGWSDVAPSGPSASFSKS